MMTVRYLRYAAFGICALALTTVAYPAFAGCDADVADADLVVAVPMTEGEILSLIATTRADLDQPTEQAQRKRPVDKI